MSGFIKKTRKGIWLLVLVTFICATPAATDAENNDPNSVNKEVLTSLEQRMQKKISVDFRDTPIEDVLRIMAEQADVDIVKSPNVIGNVTATLTEIPLEEALNNILRAHNFGYILDKNMIRIAPSAEINDESEKLISRIYRITYAEVVEVEKSLEKFISNRGSISSNPGTNHIIVSDTESKIKAIDTFINEIDHITPQIMVEARIYDITSKDRLDLGIEWEMGRNTTLVSGVGNNPTAGRINPFMMGGFSGATGKTTDTTGTMRIGWLNPAIDVDAILRAQQENTNAKLLANPRILVLDNEKALFDIVTEHPYVERTIGTTTTETVKFKPVGIKLEVTP
ncbi:MAG: hypothetical protein KAI59_00410, partial [Planctomycetes bacterium]|nr:hypothetical protein [Planctomycetota bacterium]